MTPYEIIAGPLELWAAPIGTAFPIVGAAPAVAWSKIGTSGNKNYADDGISVAHSQKVETARPAGAMGPVKAWRTEEDMMLTVTLWDMSLEQYTRALSGSAVSTTAAAVGTAGYKKLGLSRGSDVATFALMARGASAYGDTYAAQYEVPRVFQSGNPKILYKKGVPAGLELEFTALEDAAAASDSERFGRLIMQHQAAL